VRRGFTLLELIVGLAVLSIGLGIVAVSFADRHEPPPKDARLLAISRARDSAIALARPVTIEIHGDSSPQAVTAMPDGSVLSAGTRVERLTGRPPYDAR
jgi:prepilin-type N-terminal cleavage/methylation domain-containing protein